MAKVIRHTYPKEFSIGMLMLIFVLASFLASQIFNASWRVALSGSSATIGMGLVGIAVVIMVLILWEEFLFPVHIKPEKDHVTFRNHSTKLKTQVLIYLLIPAIFIFVYFYYEVNHVRFFIWAIICTVVPVVGKLKSGIKNYNDFLKLTNDTIEYKNNEKEGILKVKEIDRITLIKDETDVLHKVQVSMVGGNQVLIDLDEMELEAYYETIQTFIIGHYKDLVR